MNQLNKSSRTTEISATSIRMLEVYKQHKARQPEAEPFLDKTFDTLESQSNRLTIAINKSRLLSDLDGKDVSRDGRVRGVYYLILGYLNHPEEKIKSAAETVYKVFQTYGIAITNKNYATETALIESLLEDFNKPEIQTAISTLSGMKESVDALRTANTDFINTRVAYEKELAATTNAENASDIKYEILDTVNRKIVTYLTAMDIAEPERYATLAAEIAQVINTNNETVRRRAKKLPDETETETETTEPTEPEATE